MSKSPAEEGKKRQKPCSPAQSKDEGEQLMEKGLDLSAGACGSSKKKTEGISFSIEPDALDCPICFEALDPPIYQCYNGHITCSSCSTKVKNCPTCSSLIGLRCLAIEKVIQSIKVPCPYATSGCREIVSYLLRHVHKESCTYSPCLCPMDRCKFEGPSMELYLHFSRTHGGVYHSTSFLYNRSFEVLLPKDAPFRVLRGKDGVLFLLLNNKEVPMGNAVMVVCMGPDSMKDWFSYRLVAKSNESSTKFESTVTNIKRWEGEFPQKDFLLVPQGFCGKDGTLSLDICVQNKDKKRTDSSYARARTPRKPKFC